MSSPTDSHSDARAPSRAMDRRVSLARSGGRQELEEVMEFAQACARGAILANWKGRGLDRDRREDVVQEVLVRILDGITSSKKYVRSLQDWVKGTIDLVLRERWRQENRNTQKREQVSASGPASSEVRPDEALLTSERRILVRGCLERLPLHYRSMLLLRYQEGQSNAGIAAHMQKTEKAVEQAIPRALRLMRTCLETRRMEP